MKWIRNAWAWLRGLFRRKPRPWSTERIDDVPELPLPGVVYLVGEGEHLWFVVFKCPCRCGETIQLNLLPDARPRWAVRLDAQGAATISPSVWRVTGCRSHFFLRSGRIEWC